MIKNDPEVVAAADVNRELLAAIQAHRQRLDERDGKPNRVWWIERVIAALTAMIFALAGWVWHTDRSIQHIEDTAFPSSQAQVVQQNQAIIMSQLREINRRLQNIENGGVE